MKECFCCHSVALGVVLMASVIYGVSVYRLTGHLQLLASRMTDKAQELHSEKQKTNKLLYQMLPKSVAEQLKANEVDNTALLL